MKVINVNMEMTYCNLNNRFNTFREYTYKIKKNINLSRIFICKIKKWLNNWNLEKLTIFFFIQVKISSNIILIFRKVYRKKITLVFV